MYVLRTPPLFWEKLFINVFDRIRTPEMKLFRIIRLITGRLIGSQVQQETLGI